MPSTLSSKKIIVDGSNIAKDGINKKAKEKAKIGNIILMRKELKKYGFNDIEVICDAKLYHQIDDPKLYEEMKDNKQITQTPAGNYADKWIVEHLKEYKTKLVTNDRFIDLMEKDDWLRENFKDLRVTFMIINNKIKFNNLENKIDYQQPKIDQNINNQSTNVDKNNNLTEYKSNLPQYNDSSRVGYDRTSKGFGEKSHETLFDYGLSLLEEGDFLRAYGILSQVIRSDQKNTQAYLNRAYANRGLGQLGNAIRDYEVAIELDPGNLQVYIDRGIAYLDLKRFEEAIKDFTWVIDHDPTNKNATILRDKAYASSKK